MSRLVLLYERDGADGDASVDVVRLDNNGLVARISTLRGAHDWCEANGWEVAGEQPELDTAGAAEPDTADDGLTAFQRQVARKARS